MDKGDNPELASEARRLRDLIYGKPITDEQWEQIKRHWVRDIHWLRWTAADGKHRKA